MLVLLWIGRNILIGHFQNNLLIHATSNQGTKETSQVSDGTIKLKVTLFRQ